MTTPSLARAADALAGRLVSSAVRYGDECTWFSHDIDETGPAPLVIETSAGPDLYSGTAGIGWALAHAFTLTGDDDVRDTAAAALRHSLDNAPANLSLHAGRAGVALAAAQGGRCLDRSDLEAAGVQLAYEVAAQVAVEADGRPWDLIAGDAGIALALAAIPGRHDDLLDHALAVCRTLAKSAEITDHGVSWPNPGETGPNLCGLGHGASGLALALTVIGERTGESWLLDIADEAARYERSWRSTAGWPDLRDLTKAALLTGAEVAYPVQWCHGSAGVGIARARMASVGPGRMSHDLILADAAGAVDICTATTLRGLARTESWTNNMSVCHGIGSIVELHLECLRATGDAEHLHHAQHLMLRGLGVPLERLDAWDRGAVEPAEIAAAVKDMPCGLPGGPEVPGLMLGTAGVLVSLLRLTDPAVAPAPGIAC